MQEKGKRSINKTLNKTEQTAKEKSDTCGKNTSYSIKPQLLPYASCPAGRKKDVFHLLIGSGCKTKGEGTAVLPYGVLPDRQAIPTSDMKYFHSFLPNSSATCSGAIILVPWLALVWGNEAHCSSMAPLHAPSTSLTSVDPPKLIKFSLFLVSVGWLPHLGF